MYILNEEVESFSSLFISEWVFLCWLSIVRFAKIGSNVSEWEIEQGGLEILLLSLCSKVMAGHLPPHFGLKEWLHNALIIFILFAWIQADVNWGLGSQFDGGFLHHVPASYVFLLFICFTISYSFQLHFSFCILICFVGLKILIYHCRIFSKLYGFKLWE